MLTSGRRQQAALRRLSAATVTATAGALRQVRSQDVGVVMDGLLDLLPAVGDEYGLAAGTLAADWYDDLRDEAGASGRFLAEPAALAGSARYRALVRWGVAPLYGADQDFVTTAARLGGGMQRIVADGYRDTITGATLADRASRGWIREGRGECDWCQQYIDGEVRAVAYDFPAHDRCGCIAVPVFG